MDFDIAVFRVIEIGGLMIHVTETVRNMWIVIGLLTLFAIVVRIKSRKWDPYKKPTGLQNVVEIMVHTFINFFKGSSSEKVMYLAPWFFTLFAFLFISNILGIVTLRPPTADWGLTFPLALSSFFLIQFAGFRYRPVGYMKEFLQPFFLFLPLNILGQLARPISLSFRLFGNVLGGMILLSLLYGIAPVIVRIGIPVPLHLYFDLAAGALQAFIFTVLSITFIGLAAED